MRTVFVTILVLDLLVFCYYVAITIYELTIADPTAYVYQRINIVHIFATLFFFWIVIEYKKPKRMYAFYFFIVLIIDILDGCFVYLRLPQTVPKLWTLEVVNASLNIATSTLITGAYLLVSNGIYDDQKTTTTPIKTRLIQKIV